MTDPLSLLREFNVNKKKIIEKDDQIIFGDISFRKTVETNFLMWGSGKNGVPKEYYTLESLLFLLKNMTLSHPEYVREATAENIQVVRRPIRKDILSYLNGKTATSTYLDKSGPLETPTQLKRTPDESIESAAKKPRLENLDVQSDNQQLAARLGTPKEVSVTDDASQEAAVTDTPKEVAVTDTPKEVAVTDTPKEVAVKDTPKEADLKDTPKEADVTDTLKKASVTDLPKEASVAADSMNSTSQPCSGSD